MISDTQARNLIFFTRRTNRLQILERLEKIGIENLVKYFTEEKLRRFYVYMRKEDMKGALRLLALYPNKDTKIYYQDEFVTIQ